MGRCVVNIVNDVDILVLQDALTAVYKWANKWQLSVSIEKCYTLSLGKATNQVVLSIGNSVLLVLQSCHDLRITMTHDLSFSEHINDIHCRLQAFLDSNDMMPPMQSAYRRFTVLRLQ